MNAMNGNGTDKRPMHFKITGIKDKDVDNLIEKADARKLTLTTLDKRKVRPVSESYPFPKQKIHRYRVEPHGDEPPFRLQMRKESGLCIIRTEHRWERAKDIVGMINRSCKNISPIYRGFTVKRNRIWNFILSSDKIDKLTIIKEGNIIDLTNNEEELTQFTKYPIDKAYFIFDGEETIKTIYDSERMSAYLETGNGAEEFIQNVESTIFYPKEQP